MEANEKQEGSTQGDRETYQIQPGSASGAGEFYEIELAMLFLLRGTKSVKNQEIDSFRLASNIEEAYPFDDIAFEYRKGKESNLILLQAKHKLNTERDAIIWDNLFKSRKDFGIRKYLDGFVDMKKDKLKGPYDRMELILYTNAPLKKGRSEAETQDSKKKLDLGECDLNEFCRMVDKKVGTIGRQEDEKIVLDDNVLNSLNLRSDEVNNGKVGEFFNSFRLAYGQPNHTDLESMIKKEISSIYNISEIEAETIYNELFITVRNWWQKPYFLYENNDWFDTSRNNLLQPSLSYYRKLMKEKLVNTRIIYKSTEELEECFKSNNIINVICDEKSKILSCVKVNQMLEKCFSNKFIFLDDTSFDSVKNKVLEAFKGDCTSLAICSFRQIPNELIQIVSDKENKQIIWIGAAQTQAAISTISLKVGFSHLTDEVRQNILNIPIRLQGELVPLVDLVDGSDCDETITDDLLVDLLTGEVIVGRPLDGLGEVASYHIPRTLKRKGSQKLYRSDQIRPDDDNKFVLISACPGMGKSTLVSSMMGERFHWKYRIDLIRHSTLLQKQQNMEALLFLKEANAMSDHEYKLFKVAYEHKGGIVLFFDGFDEIAPNYKDKVLQLFQSLRSSKVDEVWVTTRPGFEEELEKKLNTEAFHLEPFSRDDQKEFLMNIWNDSDDNKVEETLRKIDCATKNSGFTEIPLHLKMISEMRNEIISSGMDIFSLYRKFFEIKFYEVAKKGKLELDLTNPDIKDMVDEKYKIVWGNHEKLALLALYDMNYLLQVISIEEIIDIMKMMLTEVGLGKEKNGIVYGIIDDKPAFTHRTYAEFFAASWMNKFYLENRYKKNFRQLRIFSYSYYCNDNMTSKFFDLSMCENSEACRAVLNEDHTKLKEMSQDELLKKDLAGRTAYHLSIFYEIFEECFQEKKAYFNSKDDIFKFTPLQYQDSMNCYNDYDISDLKTYFKCVLNELGSGEVQKTLYWACANGDLSLLKNSIENVNAKDENNVTALHLAAALGQIEVMKILIEYRALLNEKDRNGFTPLLVAIYYGKLETAEHLIMKGADLNKKDKKGNTALHWAAKMGYDCLVKSMIKRGADVNVLSNNEFTPLYNAAREGHLKVVQILLRNKANQKLKSLFVGGPLLAAAAAGHSDVVGELLRHGANPNEVDREGRTPIFNACEYGHDDVVQTLIDHKADTNFMDKDDNSPLLMAVMHEHVQIAKILLNHGADPNVQNYDDETPLFWSINNGHEEMTQVLLDKGADQNQSNGYIICSAIYYAADCGQYKIVKMLIDRGADINETTLDGKTLLHLAAACEGCIELVRSLISWGANIDHIDENGWTPLSCAANKGHFEVVKILLDNGANVDLKNTAGETPLQLARKEAHSDIVAILIAAGADQEVE